MLRPRCVSQQGTESALASDQPKKISIVIADDHPLMRRALRDLLEQEQDLQVLGEAGNGREAIELIERYSPDVVIMDIAMPVMNGVEATERIKASSPRTSVLILTVHTDIETIFSILQAGASGYLVKSVFGPEVIRTVRTLMDGDMVLAPGRVGGGGQVRASKRRGAGQASEARSLETRSRRRRGRFSFWRAKACRTRRSQPDWASARRP